MYYRKKAYPRDNQADIPDELWAEFQRIRGYMSSIDQNNIAAKSLDRDLIAPPTGLDRQGISDIADREGNFLYSERIDPTIDSATPDGFRTFSSEGELRWFDLARDGIVLRTRSRGDAPWLVGASVSAVVSPWYLYDSGSNRGNLMLRVRSSAEGRAAAEAGGGFAKHIDSCSIATVAGFLSRGGSLQFSPVVMFDQKHASDGEPWEVRITQANIFAVGLYR